MIYSPQTRTAMCLCYAALKNKLSNEGMPELLDWIIIAERMPDEITTATALLYGAVDTGVFEIS